MSRFILTAFLLFVGTSDVIAQTSPYNITLLRESLLLGGGAANGLYALSLKDRTSPISPDIIASLNPDNINSLDRWVTRNYSVSFDDASDYLAGAVMVAPAGLLLLDGANKDFLTISVMYAETAVLSNAAAFYAKGLAKRFRPFAYNPDAPPDVKLAPDAQLSFFSQHTCTAFASAMFVSTVYGDYFPDSEYTPYVWGCSFAAAGTVGIFRLLAGAHFTTDVLAGAAFGSIIGYIVPVLHRTAAGDKHAVLMEIQPAYISVSITF